MSIEIKETIQTLTLYESAFSAETYSVWGSTPFRNEMPAISFARALSCWLRGNDLGEFDRRKLLYHYLAPIYGANSTNDRLNKCYSVLPSDNLYVRRAIRNLCVIYNEVPTREFELSDKDSQTISDEIIANGRYNKALLRAHRIAKLSGECLIRPLKKNNKFNYEVYSPDLYRCKYDDGGKMIEVWIPFHDLKSGSSIPEIKFHFFNADEYRQLNQSGYPIKFEYNGLTVDKLPNKYKQLPFLRLVLDDDQEVEGGPLWELCKAQIWCNRVDFLIDENIDYNAFAMWVLINFGLKGNQEFKLSPGRALIADKVMVGEGMPMPPTAETVQPSSQYNEFEELKSTRIKAVMKNLGLPMSILQDNPGETPSGVALREDRRELDEIRNEDIAELRPFDTELLNLSALIYNVEFGGSLPTEITQAINYAEYKPFAEPKDEFELDKSYKSEGLITPKAYYTKWSGDETAIDDQDAINKMKANIELFSEAENGIETAEPGGDISAGAEDSGTEPGGDGTNSAPLSGFNGSDDSNGRGNKAAGVGK